MKKLIFLLLALVLVLSGCSGSSSPTQPPETTPIPETAGETTLAVVPGSSEVEAHLPCSTEATETTDPTDSNVEETITQTTNSTEPAVFNSYTIRIEDPEKPIYDAPGFYKEITALFEEAGVYTIVEEAYDRDGNLWGRLKSGIGWVCLTEPAIVPVFADFAPEHFVSDYEWHCGEPEFVTDIGILANQTITDVTINTMELMPVFRENEVLYTVDEMHKDEALKVSVVFWGDFTTYGLSFTDSNGNRRSYSLMISGKDGSLVCREYTPES